MLSHSEDDRPDDKAGAADPPAEAPRPAWPWPSAADLQAMEETERGIWERLIANELW
ncbi:hypothetical protein [Methylorubrum aminovorans]